MFDDIDNEHFYNARVNLKNITLKNEVEKMEIAWII